MLTLTLTLTLTVTLSLSLSLSPRLSLSLSLSLSLTLTLNRYAPYERGVPLLNISTFVTNITLVEESEMERALDAFELPHIFADADDEPKP